MDKLLSSDREKADALQKLSSILYDIFAYKELLKQGRFNLSDNIDIVLGADIIHLIKKDKDNKSMLRILFNNLFIEIESEILGMRLEIGNMGKIYQDYVSDYMDYTFLLEKLEAIQDYISSKINEQFKIEFDNLGIGNRIERILPLLR